MRFCGGGTDSFLGFEYVVVSTLASPVFEYFLRLLLQACVICAFWLCWGSHGVTPPPFLLPSRFPHVWSRYWVFMLLWRSSELQLRWRRSPRRLQRRLLAFFFPNFAIFALVLDHLRDFCFLFWCCLLCSACLFSSLSLLW